MVLTLLMALAAYRIWRVFGLDLWPPSRRLRGEIDVRVHTWGAVAAEADASRVDRARGWFWAELQNLVECPWCLGFWIAGAVVLAVDAFVSVPLPLLQWFAVACIVGLIGANLDGE